MVSSHKLGPRPARSPFYSLSAIRYLEVGEYEFVPKNWTAGLRFVPCVEGLEDRSVPAGNVQAAVLGGILTVTGDDQGESNLDAGAGSDAVVIRSMDGTTTINGQNAVFMKGIRNGYIINMVPVMIIYS